MVASLARACVVVCAVFSFLPAQDSVPPDSIGRLVDLSGLPLLTPGVTCRQFASTDPNGRGNDHGHFLRRDGDRLVLAEMDGPGVIVRLWSANATGRLQVFLDGEDEARIDGLFQDLFTGRMPPFVEPIAVHRSGGWISYFPIAYAKSCRVEVTGLEHPEALYYQVQYLTYPAGTSMRTFTRELPPGEQLALERVLRIWRSPGELPVTEPVVLTGRMSSKVTVRAGASREVFSADKPGTVLTLRLDPREMTGSVLRSLQVTASWDGQEPSVRVPLGDLFGVAFGITPYRGLAIGWDERGGYCHLPMPFHHSARIELRNTGTVDRVVDVNVRWRNGAPAANAGTLHAEFRAIDGVGEELYEFAAVPGPGKYVGVLQALQGVGDLWYNEGNEEFFVDGARTPAILGTGTEDFYNGGWYWNGGTFALPLHGLGVKQEWTTNRTTPWRLQVPDAVPFRDGFVARIEHGSVNEVRDAYYSSVALWYGPPLAVRPIPARETRLPRLWVFRPRGFVGASELRWDPATPVAWQTWEEATTTHRGLDRPLFQAFPRSHVEHGAPPVDARIAVLPPGDGERVARAWFHAPFADRYRVQLRLLADGAMPSVALDGRVVADRPVPEPDRGPMQQIDLDVGALAQGEHVLELRVPAGTGGPVGLDALRLMPASPYVRTWRIAPPVPARPDGTVEDVMSEESAFTAADFDPAAAGWRAVRAAGEGLDLNREVSPQSSMLAYLMVFVHAETAHTARLLLGSDDGVRVWVNGALCWSHELHRHLTADEDQFDVPLAAGWNRVLVKVKNDYGGFGVMLRIADPDGTLRFAAEPR